MTKHELIDIINDCKNKISDLEDSAEMLLNEAKKCRIEIDSLPSEILDIDDDFDEDED